MTVLLDLNSQAIIYGVCDIFTGTVIITMTEDYCSIAKIGHCFV